MSATATTVKFISKHRGLRLLRVGAEDRIMPSGAIKTISPELVYEFDTGNLEVEPGRDILKDGPWDPEKGEPTEQDSLAWLRAHEDYGVRFHEIEPIAPDPGLIYAKAARAAARGDVDAIHDLYVVEQESFNRPDVLDVLRDAGKTLEEALTAPEGPPEVTEG